MKFGGALSPFAAPMTPTKATSGDDSASTASTASTSSGSNHGGVYYHSPRVIEFAPSPTTQPRSSWNDNRTSPKSRKYNVNVPRPEDCVALDCEMVGLADGSSAVARVTLVDGYGEVLLDEFVLPELEVGDFRTHITGIRAEDLGPANARSLHHVRRAVLALLTTDAYVDRHSHFRRADRNRKTLVGHGLANDLKLLGIASRDFPHGNIRDTAKYPAYQKTRPGFGEMLWPRKLRDLGLEHLGVDVQPDDRPHCPMMDAVTALRLYQLRQLEWETMLSRQTEAQPLLSPYERQLTLTPPSTLLVASSTMPTLDLNAEG